MAAIVPGTLILRAGEESSTWVVYGLPADAAWGVVRREDSTSDTFVHFAPLPNDATPHGYSWDGANITLPDIDLAPLIAAWPYSNGAKGHDPGIVAIPVSEQLLLPDGITTYHLCVLYGWSSTNRFAYTNPTDYGDYVPGHNGYNIVATPAPGGTVDWFGIGSDEPEPGLGYSISWAIDSGGWSSGSPDAPHVAPMPKGVHRLFLRVLDEYGRVFYYFKRFVIVNITPVASLERTYHENDPQLVTLDASGSHDTDGTIVSYAWEYVVVDFNGEDNPPTGEPVLIDSVEGTDIVRDVRFNEEMAGKDIRVRVTVTDNDGATDTAEVILLLPEAPARFGSFVDGTRTLYSAVNDGNAVQVSRFINGVASRELLARIEGVKDPSLFMGPHRRITLAYTNRETGSMVMVHSHDSGVTFG